ncbi:Crp/Fnr family transcriptional regulator [Hymenobacter norwichensis]|uniref:Crp/Fnr family transcriptional regulator n=1 Tax=Hymenobacter norwichensis TaxID=223903 RepID=UPI0003B73F30|nr:Crp/Fnr family transcriptional regulator [Hymenobacter norwichensis]
MPSSPNLLRRLLEPVPYLTAADIDACSANWRRPVAVSRHDFLIRPGETEHQLYLVTEGVLRIFLPVADEEIYVGFGYAGTLLCSFPSFINGQPSDYAIQALRRSHLLGIARTELLAMLEQRPNLARFWRQQVEQALVGRIEREIDLFLPEPQRRLDRLRARSPHLFQLVPRKYIASYLRMAPETLSRLR